MNNRKATLSRDIDRRLKRAEGKIRMPGIRGASARNCLILQLADSVGRVEYFRTLASQKLDMSPQYLAPDNFNPIKTAIWHSQHERLDEAAWLLFLATHFGMNLRTRWHLVWAVYTRLGGRRTWSWEDVANDPQRFQSWLQSNAAELRTHGAFGNHRKYESLHAPNGTGRVMRSYIDWVLDTGDHSSLFARAGGIEATAQERFNALYESMNQVSRFGRTARFDFLTMIGKVNLADIEPGIAYLKGSTGPIRGARLLFNGRIESAVRANELESRLSELNQHLAYPFAMQVFEDALCNWQKQPQRYSYFGG